MTTIDTSTEAVDALARDHQTVGDNPAKYVMGNPHHWKTVAVLRQLVKERDDLRAKLVAAVETLEEIAATEVFSMGVGIDPRPTNEAKIARAALAQIKGDEA